MVRPALHALVAQLHAYAFNCPCGVACAGVEQTLSTDGTGNFVQDASQLWTQWLQFPALVGFGMTSTSTQQGAVVIRASVQNVRLPQLVLTDGSSTSVFSVLRFSTISNVTVIDSTFDGITSATGNQAYATVAWVDDDNIAVDQNFNALIVPAVNISNSAFSRIRGSNTGSGVVTLNRLAFAL